MSTHFPLSDSERAAVQSRLPELTGRKSTLLGWLRNRPKARVGRWGERLARKTLRKAGVSIMQVNWRASEGEADIIAIDQRRLVIVEVKTRHHSLQQHYPALHAVDSEKRLRLNKLAYSFMRSHGPLCRRLAVKSHRIDAIEVYYKLTRFGFLAATTISWHKALSALRTKKS